MAPCNSALRLAESVLRYSLKEASLPIDILLGITGVLSIYGEVKGSDALSVSCYCYDNMVCFSSTPVSQDLKASQRSGSTLSLKKPSVILEWLQEHSTKYE